MRTILKQTLNQSIKACIVTAASTPHTHLAVSKHTQTTSAPVTALKATLRMVLFLQTYFTAP